MVVNVIPGGVISCTLINQETREVIGKFLYSFFAIIRQMSIKKTGHHLGKNNCFLSCHISLVKLVGVAKIRQGRIGYA